jgi:PAT family beta-lactamase induction signal transducer AmpG
MIPSARRRYAFRDYMNRRALTMLALGFSSGLPFLLVGNTFGFWLRDEGTSLKAIGFLSWVGLAYSLQFVWAPLVDRVPMLKALGQRRGWMIVSQAAVALGLFAMAFVGVRYGVLVLGGCALFVGLSAATQDIAISAWRIEIAESADEQGLLTSAYALSYRIAVMCTDSLMLVAAQHFGRWPIPSADWAWVSVLPPACWPPNRSVARLSSRAWKRKSPSGVRRDFSTPLPAPSSYSSKPTGRSRF